MTILHNIIMNNKEFLGKILLWIKKILINILIGVIKLISFSFLILIKFLFILKKPSKNLANFIFYKIIVKIYCYYRSIIRKIGLDKKKQSLISFLLNEKTVHILVIVVTILVVTANIAQKTNASDDFSEKKQSIIRSLIKGEFGEINEDDGLIVEKASSNLALKVETAKTTNNDLIAVSAKYNDLYSDEPLKRKDIPDNKIVESDGADKEIKERSETVKYIVKSGDTISTIAEKFGISVNTILWENNLSVYDLIRIGDELAILPKTGVIHSVKSGENLSYISAKYDIDEDKIVQSNNIANSHSLKIGQKLIIPDGSKIKVIKKTNNYNSAITSVVKNIIKPNSQTTSNKMHWPTTGHRITQYYHWGHAGLDIADPIGTPLFAADSGTIERAGWNRGYGNNIVINHGGGKKTRYAHMNKFYVSHGQSVSKGQTIGEMGNTGWSTGPHIHFEVIINGKKYNPLNYIK